MMGWWNVEAKDLRVGDEIRATVMGGEEFLTVRDKTVGEGAIIVRLEWGSHVPVESFTDYLKPDEKLTVRR